MDHAVLEAERHEPDSYDALSFEHPHYDISSNTPDKEYLGKVYKIATGGFKELPITHKVLEIYEMRQRREWADSVYDGWLLSNNSRRKWFPYKFFTKICLDWEEKKNQLFEEENRIEFSLENQSSLNSTVDIDDKNNCRIWVQNARYLWKRSKYNYRDTKDSDTEDDSSTNGSASEQTYLFLWANQIHKIVTLLK